MSTQRIRSVSAVLLTGASIGACAIVTSATAATGRRAATHAVATSGPSVKRINLNGYVLVTSYSLGRNKGNTFRQAYKRSTVQGVPTKGPFVGTKFPREDYVAMPIGNHELYVAWLDRSKTHAILDAFVMNFETGVVFDYAPGSLHPESSGTVTIQKRGAQPLP